MQEECETFFALLSAHRPSCRQMLFFRKCEQVGKRLRRAPFSVGRVLLAIRKASQFMLMQIRAEKHIAICMVLLSCLAPIHCILKKHGDKATFVWDKTYLRMQKKGEAPAPPS
eukprot:NODE_2739_length_477_cov_99.179907_g2158_i0.p1 GENE.NODE_2739_length_477_cov_99.179907_g2158_i0~~NODE_2739_length_477_cov_99.179907_g2158_i0.p1  ORF type:complete len:130 (+),score=26.17 NODE_2739_length_477_cov_99.179907_g2158_i0:54-392(+)